MSGIVCLPWTTAPFKHWYLIYFCLVRAVWNSRIFGTRDSEVLYGWDAWGIRERGWSVSRWYTRLAINPFLGSQMCCSFVPYVSFNRWACGVILFTLLAGSPPFWHRKQLLMLRTIMEGRYQFSSPEWDDRSDTVKDLVRVSYARKCSEMYPIHVYMYLLKMFIFS